MFIYEGFYGVVPFDSPEVCEESTSEHNNYFSKPDADHGEAAILR